MECFSSVLKYILFIFNFLLVIVGIALMVIGGVYINGQGRAIDDLNGIKIFTIVLGSFIFLVAFFGCCGAIKESRCLLKTYAIILLVLFVLKIIVGIWAFVKINGIDETVRDKLKKGVDQYYKNDTFKKFLDGIQTKFECCGVNGRVDYKDNVPNSCPTGENIPGCLDVVTALIKHFVKLTGGAMIVFAIVEVIGAVFALYVSHSIN